MTIDICGAGGLTPCAVPMYNDSSQQRQHAATRLSQCPTVTGPARSEHSRHSLTSSCTGREPEAEIGVDVHS